MPSLTKNSDIEIYTVFNLWISNLVILFCGACIQGDIATILVTVGLKKSSFKSYKWMDGMYLDL